MEMVANGLFHSHERPDVLLARTRMLWSTYGSQIDLDKLRLRARPLDLLREATGLDFEDIAALTLAYYGYIRALQPGGLPGVNAVRRDSHQPRDRRDLPRLVRQHPR